MLLKTIRYSKGGVIVAIDVHYLKDLEQIDHASIFDGQRMGLNSGDYLAFNRITGNLTKYIEMVNKCQQVAPNYFDLMADSDTFL